MKPRDEDRLLHLYEVLVCWEATHEYPPTYRELCRICGYTSTSLPFWRLERLRERGLVTWVQRCVRTLRLVRWS